VKGDKSAITTEPGAEVPPGDDELDDDGEELDPQAAKARAIAVPTPTVTIPRDVPRALPGLGLERGSSADVLSCPTRL
jgi:hypothetical protein